MIGAPHNLPTTIAKRCIIALHDAAALLTVAAICSFAFANPFRPSDVRCMIGEVITKLVVYY